LFLRLRQIWKRNNCYRQPMLRRPRGGMRRHRLFFLTGRSSIRFRYPTGGLEEDQMGEEQAEKAKRILGMARPGTRRYGRNAAIVLSQYAGDMGSETRAKLKALARSRDAETRRIARQALAGDAYDLEDEDEDVDYFEGYR
jgi:hypothetical protein